MTFFFFFFFFFFFAFQFLGGGGPGPWAPPPGHAPAHKLHIYDVAYMYIDTYGDW